MPVEELSASEFTYRSGLLLGDRHVEFGEVSSTAIAPHVEVGISRGRFPKPYPAVDPNEDAVFAATNGRSTILSVVDGHGGFDAARAVIGAVAEHAEEALMETPCGAISVLVSQVFSTVAATDGRPVLRRHSRTALTIAAIVDEQLCSVTYGDTACFVVTPESIARIGGSSDFLDSDTAERVGMNRTTLSTPSRVVVATDGLMNYVAPEGIHAVAMTADDGVGERMIREAFAGGAGDNVAVAVAVL